MNDAENTIAALQAENTRLREALQPFDAFCCELFARNYNKGDVVVKLQTPVAVGGFFSRTVAALKYEDFLNVHATLEGR